MKQPYTILLYYHYTPVEDPIALQQAHHNYCVQNNLLGRIIIANEGLNGTLSGLQQDCQKYMEWVKSDKRFMNIDFKITSAEQHAFQKINVRIKKEIVHAGMPHIKPYEKTGTHINTATFEKMRKEPDVVVFDARSNYEHRIGKFKHAITADINHLRELPKELSTLTHLKKKKVITYCTGGVKCEKVSAYLIEQGFENVYQLTGGIIRYAEQTDGSAFEGSCYVFDNRLTVPINKKKPTIISKCYLCKKPCERMVNCASSHCNKHIPICHPCGITYQGACSKSCQKHPAKRSYNGTGYYTKKLNGYNPSQGLRK